MSKRQNTILFSFRMIYQKGLFFPIIQLLVHDPERFPLVGELGFAVGPGSETFVSIKKKEVKIQVKGKVFTLGCHIRS